MYTIEIKNLRYQKPTMEWQVKVDRSSVLGNPFYMKSEYERGIVCENYRRYFHKKIYDGDSAFVNEIERLKTLLLQYGKLELYCWCYPKMCHAQTIKEYLERHYTTKGLL